MDVHGQAALVTGAGSGLGAATARALAAAGAKVALLDLNLGAAAEVAEDYGGDAIQFYSLEKYLHILKRVYGHAHLAHFPTGHDMVGIISHLRG